MQWYNEARRNEKIHPSVLAAFVHHRFVAIHPFGDGNGRLARILMNLILMKNGYPPAIVRLKERSDYYQALNQADRNEYEPLVEFMAETVFDSINLYLKAASGGNIEDDADLDKEIALFKGSFDKSYKRKDAHTVSNVFKDTLLVISKMSETRFIQFDALFHRREITYFFEEEDDGYLSEGKRPYSGNMDLGDLNQAAKMGVQILGISHNWININNSKPSNFETKLILAFKQTSFDIVLNNNILLSKNYDEIVTDLEKNEVANKWVRLTFEDLKKKIEEVNKS